MTREEVSTQVRDERALDQELAILEADIYRTLFGAIEACDRLAACADAAGLTALGIRARLLASDARSRLGSAAEARLQQLALYEAAQPWPALARHAATYLVSSCDRLGLRIEAMRWALVSIHGATSTDSPAWHAEALMVAALFSVSHADADYTFVDRAMDAVRAACAPVVVAASAANFAEVASECGELEIASRFADDAEALMLRHPDAAAALTWESVARARLASSELPAAEHAMRKSLELEERFGCCDVNGDPWLTCAEVLLARGDAAGALAMLEHPRRGDRQTGSSSTNTRDLRTRAQVLASLHRWQEAYERMVEYAAAYERSRSIEGDRAVAESGAAAAIEEERRRSEHFEKLALTDPLTGLPNRRHAERWLAEHANAVGHAGSAEGGGLCVAIADLDHFKRINDTHSHDTGDLVLRRVGDVLLDAVAVHGDATTAAALAARLGGEEFLLAWSGISMPAAISHVEALCERLRRTSFADLVGESPVTVSIGMACGLRPVDPSTLLRAADRCLYEAKAAGRDRVIAKELRA